MQWTIFKFWVLAGSIVLTGLQIGCQREELSASPRLIREQHQKFVRQYFQGDATQAKASLEQAVRLLENETALTPLGQADLLSLDYDRLYVLETRIGNESAANIYWVKARSWNIKSMESVNLSSDQVKARIVTYSAAQRIVAEVDKIGKAENNGNLPNYILYIQKYSCPISNNVAPIPLPNTTN
jgi:hypothetical protein